VVNIKNPHKDTKTKLIAQEMIENEHLLASCSCRNSECLIVAVSDLLFKYEKIDVVSGSLPKIKFML